MRLHEAIASAGDPATVMERVAAGALALIPSAEGALLRLYTEPDSLLVTAGTGSFAGWIGTVVSLADSLSGHAIQTGAIQRCGDATVDPRVDP